MYSSVFDGAPVQTSNQTYLALTLGANATLYWPREDAPGQTYVADLIDVSPTGTWAITLPDARLGSSGSTSVISNLSNSYSFSVLDNVGSVVATVAPGTVWILYLRTNATQAGTWAAYQFGAQSASFNVAAVAGSGLKVISSALSQSMPVLSKAANYTMTEADRAKVILWTGGGGTLTLPTAAAAGSDWFIAVKNSGTGAVAVTPPSGTIDGAASVSFGTTSSAFVFTDGSNYYTVGLGQSAAASAFDYVSVDISGTGDYALDGALRNRISYRLYTSTSLTGNRNFVVPNTVQQYWINNAVDPTSDPYTLTVKTAAGTGVTIARGQQAIVYCDGTNVVPGMSGVTLPIAVASGGTGAITAAAARTNLGSSATGDAVFVAASAGAARTALGSGTIGDAVFTADTVAAAISAITGTQVTVDANGVWSWGPATSSDPTVTIKNSSSGYALRLDGNGTSAVLSMYVAGIREWTAYVHGASGVWNLYDASGSRTVMTADTSGVVSLFEAAMGVGALRTAATTDSGSFTGTVSGSGASNTPSGTVQWRRNGTMMTLRIAADIADTNVGSNVLLTGLPAICSPVGKVSGACFLLEYNGTPSGGFFTIDASGSSVALYLTYNDGVNPMAYQSLNSVGTTGLFNGWSISYPIT